eukprot:2478590-Amphidinium_carterae.1
MPMLLKAQCSRTCNRGDVLKMALQWIDLMVFSGSYHHVERTTVHMDTNQTNQRDTSRILKRLMNARQCNKRTVPALQNLMSLKTRAS